MHIPEDHHPGGAINRRSCHRPAYCDVPPMSKATKISATFDTTPSSTTGRWPEAEVLAMTALYQSAWLLKVAGSCLADVCLLLFHTWLKVVLYPPRLFMGALVYDFLLPGLVKMADMWASLVAALPGWIAYRLRWCPTSPAQLEQAEADLLSHLRTPYYGQYVTVETEWSRPDNVHIWTVVLNAQSLNTPLVLLHCFGLGLAQWLPNLDSLAAHRPVYAVDLPGFARSSRVTFSSDHELVELQYVNCLELWRKEVGLKKFIILGHNLGGFLATAYTLQNPEVVSRLILVDPWGFPEQQLSHSYPLEIPAWVTHLARIITHFNALAVVRAAGRLGPTLIRKLRQDISKNYGALLTDPNAMYRYIYHCNVQKPTGEAAKKVLTGPDGWAKSPMIHRVGELDPRIPITYIYGSRSMGDKQPGRQIKFMRLQSEVTVQSIHGGGVHVYADLPGQFNQVVNEACGKTDQNMAALPLPH